jgi:predicted acetyltransferase
MTIKASWCAHVRFFNARIASPNHVGLKGGFREVTTHPKWRNRGFATRLCGMLAQNCFEQSQVQTLIIVSEPDSFADRIYSKLGFKAVSRQIALISDPTSFQVNEEKRISTQWHALNAL